MSQIHSKCEIEFKFPLRSTLHSAGYDVFSHYQVHIPAKSEKKVVLPVNVSFNETSERAFLFLRSSIGIKKNIRFVQGNMIVPFYNLSPKSNDKIEVVLRNTGEEDFLLEKDMHFCQIIFTPKENKNRDFLLEKVLNTRGEKVQRMSFIEKNNQVKTLILEEPLLLPANQSVLVASGYKAKIDEDSFLAGFVPQKEERFAYSNGVAIGDADYYNNEGNEGMYYFKIDNPSDQDVLLPVGTEFVDLLCIPFLKIANETPPVNVRIGGVGSTTE